MSIPLPHCTMDKSYNTIVIGLGAAGTVAAAQLANAGYSVLALEAQDRIGGRVHTIPIEDGVIEAGAEWIHGTRPSMVFDVAKSRRIPLQEQELDFWVYRSDGGEVDQKLMNELVEYCLEVQLGSEAPDSPEPLGQFITRKLKGYLQRHHPNLLTDEVFLSEFLEFMNLLVDNYEASNDWNDVSAWSMYEEIAGHQHVSWGKLGYKTFFDIVLNTYKNGPGLKNLVTKLNSEVTQIQWTREPDDYCTVSCKDGSVYHCDNVIVTVSLGVLKERHATLFSPLLPTDKAKVIENLSMGLIDKIILTFPTVWWPKDVSFFAFMWKGEDRNVPKEDFWTTKIFMVSTPFGSKKSLTLWTNGDVAKLVETLPEDVVKRKCMDVLKRFLARNADIPEPTSIIRSKWYSNPYTRGSYTFDNLLVADHPNARKSLSEPLTDSAGTPRVMFAGEATHSRHFSTVHGAAETGYREAKRVIAKRSKL